MHEGEALAMELRGVEHIGERERVRIIPPPPLISGADLQLVQQKRKRMLAAGVVAGVVLLAFTDSAWRIEWPRIHRTLQWSGLLLVLVCILGRTWTTLYIGGQKRRMLVTNGPYSVVRNPLYLFTLLGAAGLGALSGALSFMAICTAFAAVVFLSVARQEEQFLLATFPDEYPSYAKRVPRLLPRFSAWQQADQLIVKPRLVHRTFFEACLFLLAVPLIGLKALARDLEWLPMLACLP
jgi:protein-S-isoprenylcysteine O-methyltransferase Ste14